MTLPFSKIGWMSNVNGHFPLNLHPDPGETLSDVERTVAYQDAQLMQATFQSEFPESVPFYEIVCQLPTREKRVLFYDTVKAIQALGIEVHWFLVPDGMAAPEVESMTDAAIAYYQAAFELAEEAGIEYLSTLPASWRGNRKEKKVIGKARQKFYDQVTRVLATALEKSGAIGFKLGLEPLSGKNRRTRQEGPALELSFPNTPDEVQPLCDAINDEAGRRVAFSVVDWAHLFYGLSSWSEAQTRVESLICHLKAGNVSRMHLSIPETRGSASPPAGSPWAAFTKERLKWIRKGGEMVLAAGCEFPPIGAESFVPSDFVPFDFILPDTGFERGHRAAHFIDLFAAAAPRELVPA